MALFAFALLSYQQRHMLSGQAPAIDAISTQGEAIHFANVQPTLVYFWGTWCPVCRITSPMVNSLAPGAKVISIAVGSGTDEQINQFMLEHQYQFDVINDKTQLHQTWGAMAFPSIYIVDAEGQIRYKTSGATSSWGMKLRLWLAKF
nr:protein disulfide oxidoreductase [Shewanella sp. Isolate11]